MNNKSLNRSVLSLSAKSSVYAPEIEALHESYSTSNFKRFCCKLFGKDYTKEPSQNVVLDKAFSGVLKLTKVAEYEDENLDMVLGLAVELDKNSYKGSQRAYQRGVVSYALNLSRDYKRAVVAFYTQGEKAWRLSFIKVGAYSEDHVVVPLYRWSFLVGKDEPCGTIKKESSKLIDSFTNKAPLVDDIEKVFTEVNAVTNEFYAEFMRHYGELKEDLQLRHPNIQVLDIERLVKNIMGQTVALFFLQKCGFLGVAEDAAWGTGDKYYVTSKIKNYNGVSIYSDVFSPLMRALAGDYVIPGERIPVINGGLFTVIDKLSDGLDFQISTSKFKSFVATLNTFNFTVSESDAYDKDVAVDPEMLGRIYESFIATEDADGRDTKKLTGAVYTPPDIVTAMCQDAISSWLQKKIPAALKEDIAEFLDLPELSLELLYALKAEGLIESKKYIKLLQPIDDALSGMHVLEPSVGSGAFLVGMLLEIVKIRRNIGVVLHFLRDIKTTELKAYSAYDLKLVAVKNSLYGVDINAGAVDIARLRVWLSLIVDMQEPHQLPNLDFKIVVGNTITDSVENFSLFPTDTVVSLTRLEELKNVYLVKEHSSKNVHRDAVTAELISILGQVGRGEHRAFFVDVGSGRPVGISKLTTQDELDMLFKKVFSFNLMFSEVMSKGGFDIVIGNPPYVRGRVLENKHLLSGKFQDVYHGSADLMVYFYAQGLSVLKEDGVLSLITTNKWLTADYGAPLRKFLVDKAELLLLVDFQSNRVFNGVGIETGITVVRKTQAKSGGGFIYCSGMGYVASN